jgi:16S rRNA (cytidine1402-2'-O)-methyltransferase
MAGTLYIVGTPIGNLGDLSDRARETLVSVDVIAAEDTRRTGRLLQSFGVKKQKRPRMLSYFDGNERERAAELLDRLRDEQDVALVTDGGMPGVSDPGYRLVRACVEADVDVRVVPGASAVLSALVLSGLPTDRFAFEGFPPKRPGERMQRLEALRDDVRTQVFFESPLRVRTLLRDVLVALGDRRVAVARELTKRHEQVIRGRASEVVARLSDVELKGEVAVVVEGAVEPGPVDWDACLADARELVTEGMRKRDAAHAVAERHGVSANQLYRALIASDQRSTAH